MRGRLYVGSSLRNAKRAREVMDRFEQEGVQITYDWTPHGQVYSEEDLTRIGNLEADGVRTCDVFLMVFPGRNGAHFECGMAYMAGKHVVLLEEVEVERKSLYYLDGIVRIPDLEQAVKHILEFMDGGSAKEETC